MMFSARSRAANLWLALALTGALGGCGGGAPVERFGAFANAGIKFADAVPPVLDAYFATTVEFQSLTLVNSRPHLEVEQRSAALIENNALLAERLVVLNDLRRHAAQLRSYFVALQALAETDAASGIGDAAKGVLGALGQISDTVKTATIGERPIAEFIPPVVDIAVARFQSAALNRALEQDAVALERELALQEAAMAAIGEDMTADLEDQYATLNSARIDLPYIQGGQLPANWAAMRTEAFKRQVQLQSVEAAQAAARDLRLGFVALVEGRLSAGDITTLQAEIEQLITFIELLRGTAGANP